MDRCVLPLLWIPGPHHYLLFSHISKLWFSMSCHSCGFQDLVITCYLATLVNCGLPVYHHGLWVFSCVSFVTSSCHEFLLYILVTTIEVVNCFSAYGLLQVCSFFLVATIQGLFFIHIATIVCRLFQSSSRTFSIPFILVSRLFMTSLLIPFRTLVLYDHIWLSFSMVSLRWCFITFPDFGGLLQSCFWSFIMLTTWLLRFLSLLSFVLMILGYAAWALSSLPLCQRSKQLVLLLLLSAG